MLFSVHPPIFLCTPLLILQALYGRSVITLKGEISPQLGPRDSIFLFFPHFSYLNAV